ncbi:MAG: RidA family protein [Actinomycetota bacterium]|nr:RidA family protein [Actinomycetota bacterium]
MSSPHEILNPPSLAKPVGFSHAVVATPGRTVYLGGQAAHNAESKIVGQSIAEQFDQAAANVVAALEAADAKPEHLVSLHIYVTDAAAYRAALSELSSVYAQHFGRHYPAVALFEVKGLFDPAALVELVGVAIVP